MAMTLSGWNFTLCVLALWRVTHLLAEEDGPWDLIAKFRKLLGRSFAGQLLDCFFCLSLWLSIAPAFWLGTDWPTRLLFWLALSGAACLLQRLTLRHQPELPAIQFLEEEPLCAVVESETQSRVAPSIQPN